MLSLVTEPSELIRVADVTIRVEAFTGNMHVEMGVPLVEEKNIFRVQNFRGVSAPFDGEQRSISVDKVKENFQRGCNLSFLNGSVALAGVPAYRTLTQQRLHGNDTGFYFPFPPLFLPLSKISSPTHIPKNEFDKCKMASSRVRICEHAHFLYRDHGLAEDLEGDVDDVSFLGLFHLQVFFFNERAINIPAIG